MIYLVIFFVLLFLSIQKDLNCKKTGSTEKVFWWLIFVLLAALRFRVGGDTIFYMEYYEKMPVISNLDFNFIKKDIFQPFWVILCSLCKTVSKDFFFFQLIHALTINTIVFWFINKGTRHFYTGILFYFLFFYLYFNMEILRESLAVCIFLVSLTYYSKNKWLEYYLLGFFATMFHLSALIILLFPLLKYTWTFRSYIILIALMIIAFVFFSQPIIKFLMNILSEGEIRDKVMRYQTLTINVNGIIFISISNVIIPLILLYLSESVMGMKTEFKSMIYFYIIVSVLSIFVFSFYRFGNYIVPIFYVYLANLFHNVFKYPLFRKIRFTMLTSLFLLLFTFQIYTLSHDTSDRVEGTRYHRMWYPYSSIFEKKIDTKREKLVVTYH